MYSFYSPIDLRVFESIWQDCFYSTETPVTQVLKADAKQKRAPLEHKVLNETKRFHSRMLPLIFKGTVA